jgi:outer membrane protein
MLKPDHPTQLIAAALLLAALSAGVPAEPASGSAAPADSITATAMAADLFLPDDTGAPARPITLQEAVELALQNAPGVIQAAGEIRNTRAGVRSAWGSFLPGLSLSAGANRQVPSSGGRTTVQDGQLVTLPDEPWSSSVGFSANLELFQGGQRVFALRGARARARAAEVNETTQRYAAIFAVKQQYFNVLAARESEEVAKAELDQAEQQLRTSVSKVRARVATRSDSLRSEIQVSNARLAVMEAQTSLAVANVSLTRTVGVPDLVTAAPLESPESPGLPFDAAALRALAENGPGVREARANLEAAHQSARSAWTDYLPSLSLGYSRGGSGTSSHLSLNPGDYDYSGSVRLSLSFPLFNQLKREQAVVQAQVAEKNAEASLRDARLAALESLVSSLSSFRSATVRAATLAVTVQAAEEDLRVQQQRYAVGNSTLLDVLTSQTQLTQARRDLIRARYDRRVARAQLEALLGRDL